MIISCQNNSETIYSVIESPKTGKGIVLSSNIDSAEICEMTSTDLRLLRNEIFARHGYIFKSPELTDYFSKFEWYQPNLTADQIDKVLTGIDRFNISLIKSVEQENSKSDLTIPLDLESFAVKFGGVWLPKEYVNEIKKSKSAYLSHNSIPIISELTITENNLKNDTLFVGSSLNNHEGYGFNIWNSGETKENKFSNNIFDWQTDKKYVFKYNVANKSISILITNDNGVTENQIDFIKVLDSKFVSNYGGVGYEYIARNYLINGKYQILDSLKNDLGIANFDPKTGEIENFKYGYYTIATDYIANPSYPSDHIIFRLESEEYLNQKYLCVINRNDTILLYETEEIVTDSTYDFGLTDIKYYMIEKNY
jgi:hypothetical protein